MTSLRLFALLLLLPWFAACTPEPTRDYDLLISGGTVYDGNGGPGYIADVAISGDRITAIGDLDPAGEQVIDATGLAVAPGFINMLSWADESLIIDGRSQSDIRQGVTLEVFGEGRSAGPLTEGKHRGQRGLWRHRHSLDHTGRVSGVSRDQRSGAQCRLLCRCHFSTRP